LSRQLTHRAVERDCLWRLVVDLSFRGTRSLRDSDRYALRIYGTIRPAVRVERGTEGLVSVGGAGRGGAAAQAPPFARRLDGRLARVVSRQAQALCFVNLLLPSTLELVALRGNDQATSGAERQA